MKSASGLVFAREDVEPEDLAQAIAVHRRGHDAGAAHDAALRGRARRAASSQVRVGPTSRGAAAKGGHFLVQALGHLADGALRDAFDAERVFTSPSTGAWRRPSRSTRPRPREGTLGAPAALQQPVGV